MLAEADALASVPGGIGSLLRREGLYSSHLATWRRARASGSLAPKQRGPKPQAGRADRRRVEELEREIERLQRRLKQAETIIEFQKKLQDLLSSPPATPPASTGSKR
ncbi:MAG: transposase [Planctomycetes bacterium]|nr:transposase [Planctomycetota bacterium]